jgi:hypothetical protein
LFYFQPDEDKASAAALVSLYGPLHLPLYGESSFTYETRQYLGDENLVVINVKNIHSAVIMAPDKHFRLRYDRDITRDTREFLTEEVGTKVFRKATGATQGGDNPGSEDEEDGEDDE